MSTNRPVLDVSLIHEPASSKGRRRAFGTVVVLLLGLLTALVNAPPASAAIPLPVKKWVNLYNVTSGKCADLPGFGGGYPTQAVNQYRCNYTGADNQRWRLIPREKVGRYQTYVIQNRDRLCMDLPGSGTVNPGTPVSEYKCDPKDRGQRFFTVAFGGLNGAYRFVHERSGFCLDVQGVKSGYDDARLTLAPCSPRDDHAWAPRFSTSEPVGVSSPGVDVENIFTTPRTGYDGDGYGAYCAYPNVFRDCVGADSTRPGFDETTVDSWPTGYMQHRIWGSGRLIKQESVDWQGAYCQWRVDFEYRDERGNQYFYDEGPFHEPCGLVKGNRSITPTYDIEENATWRARGRFYRTGQACAHLIAGGVRQMTSCIPIG